MANQQILNPNRVAPERFEVTDSISDALLKALVADKRVETLQVSAPLKPATWDRLNERVFARRPDIELRVYGFYNATCDLSFIPRMTHVRRCRLEPDGKIKGLDHIATLVRPESLSVHIFGLQSFEFLDEIDGENLRELQLGRTKSKKPSLAHLARFKDLRSVSLVGQQKDIEVISDLQRLESVWFSGITLRGLDLLRPLKRLKSLGMILGGTKNLSALQGMSRLEQLELIHVQGLSDISVISTLVGLKRLALRDLRNVRALPDLSKLTKLGGVELMTMKGITDLSPLASAPALREFAHVAVTDVYPKTYAPLLKSKSLKKIGVMRGYGNTATELRPIFAAAGKRLMSATAAGNLMRTHKRK